MISVMQRLLCVLLLGLGLSACGTESDRDGWRLLEVRTTGPCVESAMVWDTARRVFVLHGGRDRNWNLLAETWEWAPGAAAWSRVVGAADKNPGPRMSHAMVWDSSRERMLLFGGYRNEEYFDDTWAYDTKTSVWVHLQTTGNPPARSQFGMVYDPDRDEILLFGGRDSRSQPLHDTWSLDLDTLQWNMLRPPSGAPHPRARDHVQMARDPLSGITVIRGHSLGDGLPDETWHFDTEVRTWTAVEVTWQPQGARHGLLCAVEASGGLMFVGNDSDPQTWLYRPSTKTWTRLEPGGQWPEFPIDHGQVGSDGQHLYVLGGFGGDDVPADAGLTPRGALWMCPADVGADR
jgi:hypothetical protein